MATTATKAGQRVPEVKNPENVIQRSAVINPYALAELIAGRRIPWEDVADTRGMLEELLQTPYEELFDPKYDSPLYLGFRLNAELHVEPAPTVIPELEEAGGNDLEHSPIGDGIITKLADLGPLFGTKDIGGIAVQRAEMHANGVDLHIRMSEVLRRQRLARILTPEILDYVMFDPKRVRRVLPTWLDQGTFFHEAAEFFDPVQGAVANCYFIAAMSSVAWARPYVIKQLTRATGQSQQQFVDMIRFYDPSNGNAAHDVEVTELTPVASNGSPIYCRSSEAGEIWPAVYEKAFAKYVTNDSTDFPDITKTAWGDCVYASAQLTGMNRHYYDTAGRTADDLWNLVRANSLSRRTFNPMTAWTYGSGDAAPDHVNYADANLVASHCYSILGWAYENGQKYIVLRNPWGSTEASINTYNGAEWFYDVSRWRPIAFANPDGVFALRADTFKMYFGGLGYVA
jgi:Calpain family cysteine protease